MAVRLIRHFIQAMQLTDRTPTLLSAVTDDYSQPISGSNQTVYQRLKLSLSLNLRRQIFLAVCDDLSLRNRLAAQLYAELAYPAQTSTSTGHPAPAQGRSVRSVAIDGVRMEVLDVGHPLPVAYPRLVSLNLNLSSPNPIAQVAKWLTQYPPPQNIYPKSQPPGFQFLGAERLTRQPAPIQKQFLDVLQQIGQHLSQLESPLLLWVTRPWLRAIQQSAPAFWDWHTALFEFEGDPTPTPGGSAAASPTNSDRFAPQHHPAGKPTGRNRVHPPTGDRIVPPTSATPPRLSIVPPVPVPQEETTAQGVDRAALNSTDPPLVDDLWDVLTYDLSLLKEEGNGLSQAPQSQPPNGPVPHPAPQVSVAAVPIHPPVVPPPQPTVPPALAAQPPIPVVPGNPAAQATPPVQLHPLPYQPHSVQDLAELVLAIAMQEDETAAETQSDLLQALETIEQLHLQEAPAAALAEAYRSLGNLFRDRVEQGDDSDHTLLIAICAYEQVLQWLDEESSLWSDVLNDIGNLYWMLSRGGQEPRKVLAHLERAIAAYQFGLTHTSAQFRPQSYAMIQNNLGSAYGDLARYRDPVKALEQSVIAYEEALCYRTFEEDPARYAATQNNLGTAYWNLAQHHQPVRCLQQAIKAYREALNHYSPDCEPLHYAMIQNNLGTAYWNLAQHKQSSPDEDAGGGQSSSPTEWLQQAVAAYKEALKYRTVEIVPAAYAATQNNLGTAHWHLANLSELTSQERHEQLQQAIVAYRSAIATVNYLTAASTEHAPALTFDPAATHNNLGLAYYQIAIDNQATDGEAQRMTYLESALQNHLQALQAWQDNPNFYQTAFSYVLQTVRAFHNQFGLKGQQLALGKIPASLLQEVMRKL